MSTGAFPTKHERAGKPGWRPRVRLAAGALVLLFGPANSFGSPSSLFVDLSKLKAGETKKEPSISSGEYQVNVINKIPSKTYSVATRIYTKLLQPLDPSLFAKAAETTTADITKGADPCQPVKDAVAAVGSAKSEDQVPKLRQSLQDAVSAAASTCSDLGNAKKVLDAFDELLPDKFPLKPSQVLEVRITRVDRGTELVWTFTFETEERGQFLTSYGFLFVPHRDQEWFSKATEDPHKFLVTRKADRLKIDFAAAVVFGWLPSKDYDSTWVLTPIAGLGFDLSTPVVFAGAGLMFNQNIWLVTGAVARQRTVLSGEFQPNQTIAENLAADKLTSKTYGVNFFAGLSVRFGSKPKGYGETTSSATSSANQSNANKNK